MFRRKNRVRKDILENKCLISVNYSFNIIKIAAISLKNICLYVRRSTGSGSVLCACV